MDTKPRHKKAKRLAVAFFAGAALAETNDAGKAGDYIHPQPCAPAGFQSIAMKIRAALSSWTRTSYQLERRVAVPLACLASTWAPSWLDMGAEEKEERARHPPRRRGSPRDRMALHFLDLAGDVSQRRGMGRGLRPRCVVLRPGCPARKRENVGNGGRDAQRKRRKKRGACGDCYAAAQPARGRLWGVVARLRSSWGRGCARGACTSRQLRKWVRPPPSCAAPRC